ncbi:hypothetical protein KP509_29G020300 [Ceratopteris richardii]|uniref:Molybdenum cofactor sulfurase n=1 Tax=Ceratopteris richardii TaxID=49495 RepID=A0A8T2R6W7_CERRI|nr:hypothetical protein KP509_29G020300 [Ceratopteris richardii]
MPCRPAALCSSILWNQRKKQRDAAIADVLEPIKRERPIKGKAFADGAVQGASPLPAASSSLSSSFSAGNMRDKPLRRSTSQVHREFVRATAGVSEGNLISFDSLPSYEKAHEQFTESYPRFSETEKLDRIRFQEYSHLEDEELACLDYCGFGLFSCAQQEDATTEEGFSSSFSLSEISSNLWSHALFGSAPKGTMEYAIRIRIMEFLNVPIHEYSMVFTVSRGATFKLLADAYPWSSNGRLVTMYDYESESVGWMEQRAANSGARVYRARFRWPSLRVCSAELKREIMAGSSWKTKGIRGKKQQPQPADAQQASDGPPLSRTTVASWLDRVSLQHQQHTKKERGKGLFVFPVQSRVSGAKYSYQWMSLAQQNQWHVLLDASALGPKDMDSLGLSLFRPDFITASFYKLFGGDPSGFGCLFIKNSVAQSIQDSSGAPVSGMVRIMPLECQWDFSSSVSEDSERCDDVRMVSSFSGPMPAIEEHDIPTPPELEGSIVDDNHSSVCEDTELMSVEALIHSHIFSDDDHENDSIAEECPSPLAITSNKGSSGPLQADRVHSSVQPGNVLPNRKAGLPSKMKIKGLCSGLLHLHSGKVGNSSDSIGEDAYALEDALKEMIQDNGKKDNSLKHVVFGNKDLSNQDKPVHIGSATSKVQLNYHEPDEMTQHIPESLVHVSRKITEQHQPRESDELSFGSHAELEWRSLTRKLNYHRADEECTNISVEGNLETIEEIEIETEFPELSQHKNVALNLNRFDSEVYKQTTMVTEEAVGRKLTLLKESAISRETEGGFRLLGCRNADASLLSMAAGRGSGVESFRLRSISSGSREFSPMERSIGSNSDEEQGEEEFAEEPQLLCSCLDHADMMGLNQTSLRLRYLINWLVSSLLTLQHPKTDLSLVHIYGPQVRYDRGASVAFNLFDSEGKLLHPDFVRILADQVNISLGLGFLRNIHFCGNLLEDPHSLSSNANMKGATNKATSSLPSRVEVVTAALSLLSDFRDVYRLWSFVARFLDPDFVRRELGSLQASSNR